MDRPPGPARTPRRGARSRIVPLAWSLSLALAAPGAHAAAFLPGPEADPPTGDQPAAEPTPAEPLRGDGIRWAFGPWRTAGALTLDARALRFEDGGASRQLAAITEVETASYLWQPWFMQVRLGAGLTASTDSGRDGATAAGASGNAFTGRAQVSLFPASRFPFSLRAELADSRTSSDALGSDLRTRRLTLSQAYRPERGNDHYQLQIDASQLLADDRSDTLVTLDGNAMWLRGAHRFELGLNRADNRTDDGLRRTQLASLTGRHAWNPDPSLGMDTLASWHELRARSAAAIGDSDFGSDVRQLSTLVTWRPRDGDLPLPVSPSTLVVGSARWVESRAAGSSGGPALVGANATLGVSTEFGPDWRAAASAALNHLDTGAGAPVGTATGNLSLTWAPRGQTWQAWRYSPMATASAGLTRGDADSERDFATAQWSHSLSREFLRDGQDMISLTAAQSLGVIADRAGTRRGTGTTATHSLGLMWQGMADTAVQRFASASVSDTRTRGDERSSFQLVNLQWSQRSQLTRLASWSGSLTAQSSHARIALSDSATGMQLDLDGGWQHYASGTLHYEQQRLFDVPRLRFTLLAGVSTQQLLRRSAGDVDAPLSFVSRSVEARLDYTVGRLEARLSARAARVDDRSVAALIARVTRRF